MNSDRKKFSIVVPVLNEEESLLKLYDSIHSALETITEDYEIIFVDDGSTDKSYQIMNKIYATDQHVKLIKLRSHFGKTSALDAAFQHTKGDLIITMDADLQDDPNNIPDFLESLRSYEVVCGWRYKRQDSFTKKISSKIYNWLARKILNVNIHDMNCGFRGFRKEVIDELDVQGEMHRYLPALATWKGYTIGEIKVRHNPRIFGKSKYGFKRLWSGFIDMLTVKFLISYSTSPAHIFGLVGTILSTTGFILGLYLLVLKFIYNFRIGDRPLLLLSILLLIIGFQTISSGMMAEMTSRVYYNTKQTKPYIIKEVLEHKNKDDYVTE